METYPYPPHPLKTTFHRNTGPDPLENHKANQPVLNVGPSLLVIMHEILVLFAYVQKFAFNAFADSSSGARLLKDWSGSS